MNISNREKYLLGILVTLIISFGYYKLIYIKQSESLKLRTEEKNVLEEKYNNTVNSINTLEDKRKEVEELAKTLVEDTSILYPQIMQEKIILELDTMLKNSNLEGNIIFSEIEVKAIEKLYSSQNEISNSTIQDLVDQYNSGIVKEEGSNSSTETASVTETTEATVEEMKVAIKFNGNYKEIKAFIEALEKNERLIAITNITITASSEDVLSGTMNLEYHGVPKINDADSEYLKWVLKNTYGKEDLFSSGAASGAYAVVEEDKTDKDINDFVMVLRSIDSEMNTFAMSFANDKTNSSVISSDDRDEEVEITLNEEDGKLFYKYKSLEASYPSDYSSFNEFETKSKDIVINILSEKRTTEADIKKVKLKVINNTSKKVEIVLEKDDSENPRIDILTEGNKVNITKK